MMGWMVASARAWGWRFMWMRPRRAMTQASWRTPLGRQVVVVGRRGVDGGPGPWSRTMWW